MSPARPAPRVSTEQLRERDALLSELHPSSHERMLIFDLLDARQQLAERHPPTHTITLIQRADDWHACLDDDRSRWACGKTREAAVCGLIATFGEAMGLSVVEVPR